MKRIFVPTRGIEEWRALLADPENHWKRGASAMELAASWEVAAASDRGLPAEVAHVLDQHDSVRGASLIFGMPEHKVALPGGARASQTDLWCVLRLPRGWASMAVEGKAREAFGPTVDEWLVEASPGKRTRLDDLCSTLGLATLEASPLRYQLFHRAASAVMEASRIGASTAIMLVQNFHQDSQSWPDFQLFVEQFGASACRDGICETRCPGVDRLLFAWVDSKIATDDQLAQLQEQAR